MNSEKIKVLLDACFVAKRITEAMKELPAGLKPRHIHVLDCIFTLGKKNGEVRVSDVSFRLNITTPSVTKLIQELEEKGVLEKYPQKEDKRVILLGITPLGLEYHAEYVTGYHREWAKNLKHVSDEQADAAIQVINQLYKAIPKGGSYED